MGALIFVPALVAIAVFGFVFSIFAAQHYLTVLQSTGSGAKQVTWPSEPFIDNFWKVFYLGWLIGLWLGPAWFLGRAFATGSELPWMRYAVPLSVFWICYPISQLSSLSGPSIWLPFHHDVFGRLARKPDVLIGFFGLSGAILVAFGLGFHWTFNSKDFMWLFVGAPLFVVAALMYARLLGRLAFALMFTRSILNRKKKKKPRTEEASDASEPRTTFAGEPPARNEVAEEEEFMQPSELPPLQTPDDPALSGYDVKFEDDHPRPRKRVRAESATREPQGADARPPSEEDGPTAYGVHAPEVEPEHRAPAEVVKPSAIEMRLIGREDAPKPPKQVWNAELLVFLAQPTTIGNIVLLTVMLMLVGAVVRLAREFNPAADG